MEFEAIKPPKISDAVISQLERLILEGVLKPGDRLPPERELAQKLNVSRPTLREAIVIMQARGLLQARRGGGTFVCDVVAHTLTDPMIHLMKTFPEATFDVLELRHALEEVGAYYAAERSTKADREILRHRFEDMEAAFDDPGQDSLREAEADTEFHMAIADASHNLALVHVMRGLFNLLRDNIAQNHQRLRLEAGNLEIIRGQHAAIYHAVINGEPEAARAAAHAHLAYVDLTIRQLFEEESRKLRSQRRRKSITD